MKRRRLSRTLRTSLLFGLAVVAALPAHVGAQPAPRQKIGVAFGGGSARGFAHVGVIRWFEEHHVPIDLIAGTSMGGLVGGSFAAGMSSRELQSLLAGTDWNEMFGASSYRYKNIRRKLDARAYPSRLEFGLKKGLSLPSGLNNGEKVDRLLARIASPYGTLASFDDLPTPFRCVAVDLRTAAPVILDRGSLALALRSTMSLPLIFPPIESENRLLVDGGAMNNVPADVVRAMGANVVIAINVGDMSETRKVSTSLLGVAGSTMDAMMLASTRRGMATADLVINPALDDFGSLDWRRADDLADAGYAAAEAMRDQLAPFALDAAAWRDYTAERERRRKLGVPRLGSVTITGTAPHDEAQIRDAVAPLLNTPTDAAAIDAVLAPFAGFDRYESVSWDITGSDPYSLLIRARPKPYGPPFLLLSTNLQNTTSDDFSFQLAGRYLAYDVAGFGSELRIDGAIGSSPRVATELYLPLGRSVYFVAADAGWEQERFNAVRKGVIVAQYDRSRALAGLDLGVNVAASSQLRAGASVGHQDASLQVGLPILPSLSGLETRMHVTFNYDGQDSPVVPSRGTRFAASLRHIFDSPDVPASFSVDATNDHLTQFEAGMTTVWPARRRLDRLFVVGGVGTSFDGRPLITEQFPIGLPFRLDAFSVGEKRDNHYVSATAGYLRGIGRMPDFLGGPIFVGGWVENGSAFDHWSTGQWHTQVGLGLILDTLLGPALAGISFGFDGEYRYYIGIGRLF